MSVRQIETLIEFLEGQPELALGRCSRSKEGRSLAKRLWQECALLLNSVSSDCVKKTGEQWRMFYNEFKHRLLKKIKKEKRERIATGGGPPAVIDLTPLQNRLYMILGQDVGEPLPGVRHNPFTRNENEDPTYHAVNDFTDDTQLADISGFADIVYDESQPGPLGLQEPIVYNESQPGPSGLQEPLGTGQRSSQTRQTARRRRHRRQEITDDASMLRASTEVLEALEERSISATNRLAAAVEALVARLNEPLRYVLEDPAHSVHRRMQTIDSDSE